MKIVVDANIIFSGILKSNGKIGDKRLTNGLIKKNYKNILTTEDLFLIRNAKLKID
jgi:predicted nucleic acid-binding protein